MKKNSFVFFNGARKLLNDKEKISLVKTSLAVGCVLFTVGCDKNSDVARNDVVSNVVDSNHSDVFSSSTVNTSLKKDVTCDDIVDFDSFVNNDIFCYDYADEFDSALILDTTLPTLSGDPVYFYSKKVGGETISLPSETLLVHSRYADNYVVTETKKDVSTTSTDILTVSSVTETLTVPLIETTVPTTMSTTVSNTDAPNVSDSAVTFSPATEYTYDNFWNLKFCDIASDQGTFAYFANELNSSLLHNNGYNDSTYGLTFGGSEKFFMLAILNENMINDDVIALQFNDHTIEKLEKYSNFYYIICKVKYNTQSDFDFCRYTLDREIGAYLNYIYYMYENDRCEELLYDIFVNGNIGEKYLNSTAVMAMLCGCDKNGTYLTKEYVDANYMDGFINKISELALGKSYTR